MMQPPFLLTPNFGGDGVKNATGTLGFPWSSGTDNPKNSDSLLWQPRLYFEI